jgi:hypothetical protein
MECTRHQKSFVGMCQLCGTNLCKLCIAKIKGNRVWCASCSQKMDSFPELRVHHIRDEGVPVSQNADAEWFEVKKTVKLPERSCTEKFGYFDFASLAKNRKI